ncbi:MAG: tRNA (N(6)-L-threonylcarbamoyladenosine(37)-C(2))-methylthiotransferase [Candidatus Lokiarchaeota archaeon]|nr:tRNA (N(6)-L-threonylcarbamoyladenosine(37)-C(2))-methylthiotransferase [Candidatus Lokiarchaeota archaeon]MBD3339459.1 tRNA (N(6)-L-threonylcarbamoyladenosine(37)-C(2))-methylthiotransferase [Candidatus Lokiarchaeota archaeon]
MISFKYVLLKQNSFYIETYGCTANKADSYIISTILKKSGFVQAPLDSAQFIIVNTCAVKEQTENKINARLGQINSLYGKDKNKHIIVAGCLPHIAPDYLKRIKKIIPNFSAIIDVKSIHIIDDVISKIRKGESNIISLSDNRLDKAKYLIDYPKGKITGIVPISEGCLGACSYCCVKNARGKLNCYSPQNILKNVRWQLKRGIKQIYLTSQDCSIYQFRNTNLADLVERITSIESLFYLRLGMLNPLFLKNSLDQLIRILSSKKVYQFLHIPIQSGSDMILKKMKRPYRISDIIEPIDKLKRKYPNLTLSTDIICGFPTESEYDFSKTINLMKWLRPNILNISKFTTRPNTAAKRMNQLDNRIIKDRAARLSKVYRKLLKGSNQKWIGWKGDILILHRTNKKNQVFGRNFAYKNVFVDDYDDKMGKSIEVEVIKVKGYNLFAKLLQQNI